MIKYLTHKLKTQSINEENSNEKVSKVFPIIFSGKAIFHFSPHENSFLLLNNRKPDMEEVGCI